MVGSDVGEHISVSGHLLIAAFKTVGALPFALRSRLGFVLGYLGGLCPTREKKIAQKQLELFFPELRTSRLAPRVFANVVRATFESLNLSAVCRDPEAFVSCKSWPEVESWLNQPRPLVVLTAHTGNWDLLAAYAIARGAKITTIGREARVRAFHEGLRWIREQYQVETIWRSNRAGLKRLISCFRENRTIAALIDQDTRVESVFVPFFGKPARTPSSLIELGRKFNARFAYAFIFRTSPNSFELSIGELDCSGSTEKLLTQYSRELEAGLRKHPDQWVWFHKRWRSAPERATLSSREYLEWLQQELLKNSSNRSV